MQTEILATERTETTSRELPEFLTVDQFREVLGIGKDLSYQLAQRYGVRLGGKLIRIPRAVVEELARGRKTV